MSFCGEDDTFVQDSKEREAKPSKRAKKEEGEGVT